jgi:hypothetical protein
MSNAGGIGAGDMAQGQNDHLGFKMIVVAGIFWIGMFLHDIAEYLRQILELLKAHMS